MQPRRQQLSVQHVSAGGELVFGVSGLFERCSAAEAAAARSPVTVWSCAFTERWHSKQQLIGEHGGFL